MRSRRRRHEDHDEEASHERWLVTYADMVTLLMVLFIIMFAMSTVDQKKFAELRNGLADGFGHSINILNGANAMLDDTGAVEPGSNAYDAAIQDLPAAQQSAAQQAVNQAVDQAMQQQDQRQYADAKAQVNDLVQVWHRMQSALAKKGLADDVRAKIDERGLVVSLVSKHVVFEPNVATLTTRGEQILDTIAPVLTTLTEPIEVDGHTNQVKVKPKYYPTDWELSSARADTALRWLNEHDGLPDKRLSAAAFGHTKPLVDPKEPGSQDINKRVDVIVLSQAPATTREKYAQIQNELNPTTQGDLP
jgi:chemotaxis protein MotB